MEDMTTSDYDTNSLLRLFNPTKQAIIKILKIEGTIDLGELSSRLNISKMGVLNHIKKLEDINLIERKNKKEGVGRPKLLIKLSPMASRIFPNSFTTLSYDLLDYISIEKGDGQIGSIFEDLFKKMYYKNGALSNITSIGDKLQKIKENKEESGYIMKLDSKNNGDFYELIQYTCPFGDLSSRYPEICNQDQKILSGLLNTSIEVERKCNGDNNYCKFIIKNNN